MFATFFQSLRHDDFKICFDRNESQDIAEVSMTKNFSSKIEFFVAIFFSISICVMYVGFILSPFLMTLNQYQLPIGFVITFLPFDRIFSFNWMLNYIFQGITVFFAALLFAVYSLQILAIVNHSCL